MAKILACLQIKLLKWKEKKTVHAVTQNQEKMRVSLFLAVIT